MAKSRGHGPRGGGEHPSDRPRPDSAAADANQAAPPIATVRAIRLLVADDHPVVREGLRMLVARRAEDMVVVAEAETGPEAVSMVALHRPDIVLLDLFMPGLPGQEVLTAIRSLAPDVRVIVVTGFGGEEDVYQALRAGASGYLLKDASRDELLECIRRVHAGEAYISPVAAARLTGRLGGSDLTPRERDVLRLIVAGCSNKEISTRLKVAEGTVKAHVNRVLRKLDATSRTQAITEAMRRGLVHLQEP